MIMIILSILFGIFTSMTGKILILSWFPNKVKDERMREVSSYAYGLTGWSFPFFYWLLLFFSKECLVKKSNIQIVMKHQNFDELMSFFKMAIQRAFFPAFIINSFFFGIAVVIGGMIRTFIDD